METDRGMQSYDVVVIGAGAAGMMCAAEAGKRGRSVLVVEHAAKPGEKIRISGGGRCNFTNIHASPKNFLSQNPHFCISALSRYTQRDFVAMVERHGIAYQVFEPKEPARRAMAYADNFSFQRRGQWTH